MTDEPIDVIEARAEALHQAQSKLLEDLIELRGARGLSQETVADRMGVSQPTVSAFERYDANPTLASIRRYALAVGARLRIEVVRDDPPEVIAGPRPPVATSAVADFVWPKHFVIKHGSETSVDAWADTVRRIDSPNWSEARS